MRKEELASHWGNKSLKNIQEVIDGVLHTEEWREIEGYEGLYQISSFGRVKSLERTIINIRGAERHSGCFILAQTKLKVGYTKVGLYKDNQWATKTIHRLVAIAFLENSDNKPEVNHVNGVKHDNRVAMLRWATSSENSKHKFDIGLQTPFWVGKYGKHHPSSRPVNQYDKNMVFLKKWESISEASIVVGGSKKPSWISACCRGSLRMVKGKLYETKSAYGYKWKYA